MGSMIGSGIFIVSADIARLVNSPGLLILVWLITGVLTITGALSLAELAAMLPHAGGQYIFLREAMGRLCGFLYGWTLFLVIQTGTIAAVSVAFGKFLGVLFPTISASNWFFRFGSVGLNTQNLVAVTVTLSLTLVNILGVKSGALVQNVLTTTKILSLLGVIIIGLTFGKSSDAVAANFNSFFSGYDNLNSSLPLITALAIAQVGSLFSADAWNNVTFAAAEVKNPEKNLPRALIIGAGTVILLYLLCNLAYLTSLPLNAIKNAPEDRVATVVMLRAFGPYGAQFMAIAILISTFGCVNGMILAGARVYYAMSKDGLFFSQAQNIHPKFKTPIISLILQGAWASILCISGSYGQLLDYVIFAAVLFYILTIISLFILRKTRPNANRPYKAMGYPYFPLIYILIAGYIEWTLLIYKPQYTWPGLAIVASGIPVYWLWSKKSNCIT